MIIIIILIWAAIWAYLGYKTEQAKTEQEQLYRARQRAQAAAAFTAGAIIGAAQVTRDVMRDGE